MITENEQNQLKEIIGAHYADDVSEILNNKGIRNRNGHPHQISYIHKVFQGNRTNADIEAAIWELASIKQEEAKAAEKLKNKILNAS